MLKFPFKFWLSFRLQNGHSYGTRASRASTLGSGVSRGGSVISTRKALPTGRENVRAFSPP